MVTKARWRKPSYVSRFTLETCRMENITRWQTVEGMCQQRLGLLPLQIEIKIVNANEACLLE